MSRRHGAIKPLLCVITLVMFVIACAADGTDSGSPSPSPSSSTSAPTTPTPTPTPTPTSTPTTTPAPTSTTPVPTATSATTTTTTTSTTAVLMSATCSRVCGPFETCFVYNGAEFCAPTCGDGRCNTAQGEVCVLRGQACSVAPCMPLATCVSRSIQTPQPQLEFPNARPECERDCPLTDNPVCGSDGVSYLNTCVFQQAQCDQPALKIVSVGLCPSDVAFNDQYNPHSSSPTGPDPAAQQQQQQTSCSAIICADVDDPVCTSKGTMRNVCFWQRARCVDPTLELRSRSSACETSDLLPTCPTACSDAFVPVCASNGVIYDNECLFRQAKCARRSVGELRRLDLSYCEQWVGDSIGSASDLATVLAFTTVT